LRTLGFTLVEVLVVIVILALAAGIAVSASRPDARDAARREAVRFGGTLEYAARRAQMRAETLGVDASGRQIRFWKRSADQGTWVLVTGDDVLAARTLADPLRIATVSYGGRALTGGAIVPLRPSGRNEPSRFAVLAPQARVTVTLDPLNRVSIGAMESLAP
jgi:type II secretion system protein H